VILLQYIKALLRTLLVWVPVQGQEVASLQQVIIDMHMVEAVAVAPAILEPAAVVALEVAVLKVTVSHH
jgi:hypothetical protein